MKSYRTPTLMSVVMVTRPPQKLRNVLIWKGFKYQIKEDRLWRSEARQIICSLSRHHFYITRFPAGCHIVTHICETRSKVHRLRTLEAYHQCNTARRYLAQNNHNLADLPLSLFLWKKFVSETFQTLEAKKLTILIWTKPNPVVYMPKKIRKEGVWKLSQKKGGLEEK